MLCSVSWVQSIVVEDVIEMGERVVVGREAHLMEARKQSRGPQQRFLFFCLIYAPHVPTVTPSSGHPSHESCLESPCRPRGRRNSVLHFTVNLIYSRITQEESLSE